MQKITQLLLSLLLLSCGKSDHSLESPDGQLRVTYTDGRARNSKHWNMPAHFQPTASTYVLLAEANVLRNQCGAYLSNADEASIYRVQLSDEQLPATIDMQPRGGFVAVITRK